MNLPAEHLTVEQLWAYRNGALPDNERREIGRHLLQCKTCLAALPAPTPEQFWNVVFKENAVDDSEKTKKQSSGKAIFGGWFSSQSILIWSGGAMASIVLGLTVSVWLASVNSFSEKVEVAKSYEHNISESGAITNENDEQDSRQNSPIAESKKPLSAMVLDENTSKRDLKAAGENQRRDKSKSVAQTALPVEKKNLTQSKKTAALTRGKFAPCEADVVVKTEIGSAENKVVLTWKKVPNATKYHLYVADDDEILVDEYETEQETFYVLKKPLDPSKSYVWKVMATFENGSTVVGSSQQFTIKNLKSNQQKFKKNEVRCALRN